ncbi:hypothetical protein SAMN02799630_03509 [Paenibacillus sp. UNCCL117]|uniref:hypothetical protein n=1 Tax=unclassified Paenibacillus TaxID=185978 RepID=UPI0008813E99|nr:MULTISPECIES: hypothetical protein [unclassified Paenibacillus]SDD41112.1 hypothetical protein SAMN04488602_108110 [Paenibacillus sp. cl123]SFW47925.1 hypothetical protein SAMN02799630_03509 [Paenibacillus sp. UNCCL117]
MSMDYVYLTICSIIYSAMIFASPNLNLMKIGYVVPIGLSIMFFDKRKLLFTMQLSLLSIGVNYGSMFTKTVWGAFLFIWRCWTSITLNRSTIHMGI